MICTNSAAQTAISVSGVLIVGRWWRFGAGVGWGAHLLEGVFKQRLPGHVDLDVAGQSVGLFGGRGGGVEGKDGVQS